MPSRNKVGDPTGDPFSSCDAGPKTTDLITGGIRQTDGPEQLLERASSVASGNAEEQAITIYGRRRNMG